MQASCFFLNNKSLVQAKIFFFSKYVDMAGYKIYNIYKIIKISKILKNKK